MLELIIHEKNVETVNEEKFIRGTVGAKCKIIFDEFWQNYEKTVVFKNNDFSNPPKKVFVSETVNVIEIPPEILTKLGYFVIGAYGITEDEKLPTLYSKEFDVVYGTDTECVDPSQYTPSEIDQLRLSKQDKLTAGDNITIDENNVISATGGGGSADLTDYVKKTDYATADTAGVVKVKEGYGITLRENTLLIFSATNNDIKAKTNSVKPIAPNQLDYAIKIGLTTNTETLTNDEKAAAQAWLGVTDLVGNIEKLLGGI